MKTFRQRFIACVVGVALSFGVGTERILPAQTNATSAASPASAPTTLAELAAQRNLWPAQVTLNAPVRMVILSNGKEAGAITSPAGVAVDLISVTATGLQVKVMQAAATVPAEETDLWSQVAALSKKPGVDTATGLLTLPPLPSPVSPPTAAPQPAPPPTTASRSFDNAPAASGGVLEFDYEVPPRDNFDKAAFHFWVPVTKDPIRGVILMTPGSNGDGRGMAQEPEWQALARKYHLALMADFLQSQGRDYCAAANGSGQAVFDALKQFAQMASHPEIVSAPLALYGESAGGQFDYNFALWKPERVICFVVNKGRYYNREGSSSVSRGVPGLFILGLTDEPERINAITEIWTEGRDHGARWALARQPNSGHEFSKTAAVARAFFEPVFKLRLPDDSASLSGDPAPLKPVEETPGWLGDETTFEIHEASADQNPDRKAGWFPDENSAKVWKDFVSH